MTKRDITLVAFGAVAAALGAVAALLAYGVFVSPSAEVPEVPEELTVADIDAMIAEVESDKAYLVGEMENMGFLPTGAQVVDGEIFPGWQVCGNQYGLDFDTYERPEIEREANRRASAYSEACGDSIPDSLPFGSQRRMERVNECWQPTRDWRMAMIEASYGNVDLTAGNDYPPCKALLDEWDLTQQRLDELRQERVRGQMRERERE